NLGVFLSIHSPKWIHHQRRAQQYDLRTLLQLRIIADSKIDRTGAAPHVLGRLFSAEFPPAGAINQSKNDQGHDRCTQQSAGSGLTLHILPGGSLTWRTLLLSQRCWQFLLVTPQTYIATQRHDFAGGSWLLYGFSCPLSSEVF